MPPPMRSVLNQCCSFACSQTCHTPSGTEAKPPLAHSARAQALSERHEATHRAIVKRLRKAAAVVSNVTLAPLHNHGYAITVAPSHRHHYTPVSSPLYRPLYRPLHRPFQKPLHRLSHQVSTTPGAKAALLAAAEASHGPPLSSQGAARHSAQLEVPSNHVT